MTRPLADPHFRRLLAVFVANGIASAIPATLVLFFIADVLRADVAAGPLPRALLRRRRRRHAAVDPAVGTRRQGRAPGRSRCSAAIAAFVWAALLGPGDMYAFAVICALSGLALGADLALPPSMLADVIGRRRRDARPPARTSACGRSRPSSTSRSPRASPCRCSPRWATRRARRTADALAALAFVYAARALPAQAGRDRGAARLRQPIPGELNRAANTRRSIVVATPRCWAAPASTSADYRAEQPAARPRRSTSTARSTAGACSRIAPARWSGASTCASTPSGTATPGTLDEHFEYSDGEKQNRVWTLVKDGDRYTGTAGDVVGTATGNAAGQRARTGATCWRVPFGGAHLDIDMDDWMYLHRRQDDAQPHRRCRKFGVRVGEVTLSFRKR